jgi:hypothetical protein
MQPAKGAAMEPSKKPLRSKHFKLLTALLLGFAGAIVAPVWGQDDPCNATIVADDGAFTARDLCDMIAASGKNVTVFHSQCYGGDTAQCCNSPTGGGCHSSGGSPGQVQYYGEYDQGTANAIQPGNSASNVHQSVGVIGASDSVITYAGKPNQLDHDMAQQIAGQNADTTNLEGDGLGGLGGGVEGAATAANLKDAIHNAASQDVWIWISDHGNKGGPSETGFCEPGGSTSVPLIFFDFLLADMARDPGDTAFIFLDSLDPFPETLSVTFNSLAQIIQGQDAVFHQFGEFGYYRYPVPVPESSVSTENDLVILNLTTSTPFEFSAFVDSGPIEKPDPVFTNGFESGDVSAWTAYTSGS